MINIDNKNNFTLFILHWTYKYGNIYFLGDMWKFWKIQRTESLARGMSLVTKICIESLNWNLYSSTYTRCLMFFFYLFIFFLKMTFETLQSNQENLANEKYFWNVTALQKKANQEWETKPQARTLISLWFYG